MKTLLSQQELRAGVERLAREIQSSYGRQPVTIIAVLTGSLVLLADLIRLLDMPLRVGVVQASSYQGTQRQALRINADWMLDVRDREVLLIDDIFDTGYTLVEVLRRMQQFQPRSVRSAVLLRKSGRQEVPYTPDFVAFEIPDEFVVGYGLDYHDQYRHLPFLAALDPEDIETERG